MCVCVLCLAQAVERYSVQRRRRRRSWACLDAPALRFTRSSLDTLKYLTHSHLTPHRHSPRRFSPHSQSHAQTRSRTSYCTRAASSPTRRRQPHTWTGSVIEYLLGRAESSPVSCSPSPASSDAGACGCRGVIKGGDVRARHTDFRTSFRIDL